MLGDPTVRSEHEYAPGTGCGILLDSYMSSCFKDRNGRLVGRWTVVETRRAFMRILRHIKPAACEGRRDPPAHIYLQSNPSLETVHGMHFIVLNPNASRTESIHSP